MRTQPIYLNLFTFKFPVTAFVSILHRISGFFLVILIPIFLEQLDVILHAPHKYSERHRILLFIALVFFIYHLFAGCRHLVMDAGFAENKIAAKISSYVVFVLTVIAAIAMGYVIW